MNKETAKALVTDIYNETIEQIDNVQNVKPEILIDYLHNIARKILETNLDLPFDFHSQQVTFEQEYKEIAQESIDEFASSNKKIAQASDSEAHIFEDHSTDLIDTSIFNAEFEKAHNILDSEVQRANDKISKLVNKVIELETKSNLDPLTKVFNRRSLQSYLEKASYHVKSAENMHLMILDIDDFKSVNDQYGHVIGDKVLVFISNVLKKILRDGDKIFRYGGEEFIIILNRIDSNTCKQVANRILTTIENNKLLYKEQSIHVTVSIGATTIQKDESAEAIIDRADQALYKAKSNGKNQIKVKI